MNTHIKLKKWLFVSTTIAFLLLVTSCSTDETQTVTTMNNLLLNEEFEVDGELTSSIWSYEIGRGDNGWGNNELQYYTNRKENVSVQNGFLIITANKEAYEGASYTSARIITKGLFEQAYGRFEAKIKMPWGQGIWPAFWLLGNNCDTTIWPECGEIDIMEYKGQEPATIHGSVHGPGYAAGNAITKSYTLQNERFDDGFHVFGIEWTPTYINYYVDDVLYNQITKTDVTGPWVFDHPFYIIINLAVGGNFVGAPNAATVFPQRMIIDYVKVYQPNQK